jgi:hypothetical protein
MNFEIMRMYHFAERVEAKRRLLKTKARIKAKHAAGLLGKMPVKTGCYIMSRNGVAYQVE